MQPWGQPCLILLGKMDLTQQGDLVDRTGTDPEAFGELYDQHYSRIFGYVLRRTASVETAQDVNLGGLL